MKRRTARTVTIRDVTIGGDSPVAVQSMTKTDTRDSGALLDEICRLESAGCELVRIAVFDDASVDALAVVRSRTAMPLIADVHFSSRIAMSAIEAGADKLRINPGNIGDPDAVAEIARRATRAGIPIRVGANAGSLPRDLGAGFNGPTGAALAEAAMRQITVLEDAGCEAIVVSCKAFDPMVSLDAYRRLAELTSWPFHIGITEAGPPGPGTIRSAVGISILLAEGFGDTIRVSLTGPGELEVAAGYEILSSLGLRRIGPELVSCPTCGRCRTDLLPIVNRVREHLDGIRVPIRVAVMGCVVNGPGEAREADVGVAAGDGRAAVFAGGRVVSTVPAEQMVAALLEEIDNLVAKKAGK